MKGDFHRRFRENAGVKLPCATRLAQIIKMTKGILSTLVFMFFCYTAIGQHNIGLKINGGICYFTTKAKTDRFQQTTQRFYLQPSGQTGLYYNFQFANKFSIGTEILFVPIYGKEYREIHYADYNGTLTGEYSKNNVYRHVYFLGIPVYCGYNFKKVNINFGCQTNISLIGEGKDKGQAFLQGNSYTWDNKWEKFTTFYFDIGTYAAIRYAFIKELSIELNYYLGLTNLIKDRTLKNYWKWKVQQLSVGVCYTFYSHGRHK
jgi:hypothetical protein